MASCAAFGRAMAIAGLTLTGPVLAATDETPPLSPAQIALFETDHLKAIRHAERLEYRYRREASEAGGGYDDRVDLDVRPREDGGKNVWVDFLSGERHRPYPPLMDFHGNPLIMFFLEHDVGEMNRLTGAAATYFRNTIRRAFVDRADVHEIGIERDGKTLRVTEITLVPFKEDAHFAVFPGIADKQYRFLLSDEIPGSVLEIEAMAPSKTGAFSSKETMMFEGEAPCSGDIGPCSTAGAP